MVPQQLTSHFRGPSKHLSSYPLFIPFSQGQKAFASWRETGLTTPQIIHLERVLFAHRGRVLPRTCREACYTVPTLPKLWFQQRKPTASAHRGSPESCFELRPEMLLKDFSPWPSNDDLFLNFVMASYASFDHLGSYKKLNTSY